MAQKRGKFVFFALLFIIFSTNSIAWTYTNADGDEVEADYNNDNFYKDVGYNNKDIDWNKFDQSKVPANRVNEIPADKVKVNGVKDQSKLTADQLRYGDNYNQVADKSKLDPAVRNQFLSDKTKKNVKSEVPPGTKGTAGDDGGFMFDKVNTLQMDNNLISGGTNVSYTNGILSADHADSFVNTDFLSSNVDFLEAIPPIFKVLKADSVISGCVEINDAENSEFKIYSNAVACWL